MVRLSLSQGSAFFFAGAFFFVVGVVALRFALITRAPSNKRFALITRARCALLSWAVVGVVALAGAFFFAGAAFFFVVGVAALLFFLIRLLSFAAPVNKAPSLVFPFLSTLYLAILLMLRRKEKKRKKKKVGTDGIFLCI